MHVRIIYPHAPCPSPAWKMKRHLSGEQEDQASKMSRRSDMGSSSAGGSGGFDKPVKSSARGKVCLQPRRVTPVQVEPASLSPASDALCSHVRGSTAGMR